MKSNNTEINQYRRKTYRGRSVRSEGNNGMFRIPCSHDLSADEIREAARVLNAEHAPVTPDPVREIDEIIRSVERLMIKHKGIAIIGPLGAANVQLYTARKAIKETAVSEGEE